MEGVDSNTVILPDKKKNKEKLKTQVKSFENKKLSKSQKRKLKKLAEHNEAKKLLSKSLEALEKYKISEDAHSLMHSSQNVGQAMTRKEKRGRDMLLSKVGLEVPENGLNAKRKRCESRDQITSDDHDGSDPINLINGVRSEGTCKVMEPYTKNKALHHALDSDKKTVGAVVEPYGDSALDSDFFIKRTDDSDEEECKRGILDPRPLKTPFVVHVSRPKEVEDSRKDLPVVKMEQEIMQDINKFIVVGIEGGTGSGKTTQVPQFLYEAGYGLTGCNIRGGVIGVTQPRRVAVFSTAKRVAYELGLTLGREVGFQVRYDKKIGENSSIKFMTDGILLRELQNDFLLKRYSVLILDEVHERSLNTDILIGMLSRVIMQRLEIYKDQHGRILGGEQIKPEDRIIPLKVILMSATMQVKDFEERRIFGECLPSIKAEARRFDLTIRYARRTEFVDYIGKAFNKVLQIHKRCPPGGILVFVTGRREVEYLCRKLQNASKQFRSKSSEINSENETTNAGTDVAQIDGCDMKEINEALDTHLSSTEPQAQGLTFYDDYDDYDESDNVDSYPNPSSESDIEWDSERDDKDMGQDFSEAASNPEGVGKEMSPLALNAIPTKEGKEERGQSYGPLHVLPIYAMLPAEEQHRVFDKTKEGERLVVVATNVAETSITIEGIKYVVDTGRVKVKKYDPSNGMESYEIQWISEASAKQRAGRAGRTGPGYCFPLYTKAAMENTFPKHSLPEILKRPVDGVVLLMKSIGISKVTKFPFLTPPDPTALAEAERCLKALEALDSEGRPTPLGKTMTQYPMSPRHSRLLLLAIQIAKRETNHIRPNLVLGYAVAVAAVLSSTDPNSRQAESKGGEDNKDKKLRRNQMKECHKRFRGKFANLKSDALTIAFALQCFEQSENQSLFCNENALHQKTMDDMSKLRKQLLQLVFNQRYSGLEHEFSWTRGSAEDVEHDWSIPYDKNPLLQTEENILCQAICAGWADRVAKRVKRTVGVEERERKVNAVRYQSSVVKETVFLRPWSTVARSAPEFLVYNEMLDGKRSDEDGEYSMPFISAATSVESEWLVKFARNLCTFSAPLEDPKPFYDPIYDQTLCYVIPYFGPHLWELPLCKVPIKDAQQRVVIFAHALLDGHVLPCLKFAKKYMSALPGHILRPEALGQKRVGNLLSKLITRSKTVDNCAILREVWSDNPRYLYSEFRDWFQEGFHSVFEELWENMHREARLEPQERFPKKKGHRKSG